MVRKLVILFILIVILNNFVHAEENLPDLKINEFLVNMELEKDGSVHYQQSISLIYNLEQLNLTNYSVVFTSIPLPKDAQFYPDFTVKELLTNDILAKVNLFDKKDCNGQYIFDSKKNIITICFYPKNEVNLEVSLIILPDLNFVPYKTCDNQDIDIGNEFKLNLSPTKFPYPVFIEMKGTDNVNFFDAGCTINKNATNSISNSKSYSINKGVICTSEVLGDNKIIEMSFNLRGLDSSKILEAENQEMKNLTKENILVSISANKNVKWNIFLTLILVLITAFYAFVSHKTLKEMERSKIPLVTGKLDPLGESEVVLKILNVGKSTARNIKLNFKVLPKGPSGNWKHHLLQVDDFARLVINNSEGINKFLKKYKKITINSEYDDIYKKSHKDYFEINLEDFGKSINENLWILETSQKEDMEQISKNLKEISSTLKSKKIKVDVQNIDINPNKLKSEIKMYEHLLEQKKKALEKLKKA
jgi:hypothetical protein